MIDVQGVSKRFGATEAVKTLSFAAPDGAITGLLGINGAGKTTTLRIIGGVLKPDAGSVTIGGVDPLRDPAAGQARLGALLDDVGVYSRLTARENLVYFARLRGLKGDVLRERMERVLAELGLADAADRAAGVLSQGQRMKIALGRVLIHEPAHLLLDEPTNGLDVPTVRALRQLLAQRRAAGACIVFSSHVLAEVENLCDRIVVIAEGTVVGQGTSRDLCRIASAASLEEAFLALTADGAGPPC